MRFAHRTLELKFCCRMHPATTAEACETFRRGGSSEDEKDDADH
jgi:hypothetical protein